MPRAPAGRPSRRAPGPICTWPSLAGRPRASPISQRITSLTCTMPRGSSSVSRNRGRRETPAASKVFSSSQTGSFSSTAMMSARGTMTSTTRNAPKRRMRSSISRSSAEKARSSPAPLRASSSIARSVGAPGRPSLARRAASQLCEGSGAGSAAPAGVPSALSFIGLTLLMLMAGQVETLSSCTRIFHGDAEAACGSANADRRQDVGFQALHLVGRRVGLMVVAQQMQEAVDDEMLEMVPGLDPALARLQPRPSRPRAPRRPDRRRPRRPRRAASGTETTGRWWPRPCRDRCGSGGAPARRCRARRSPRCLAR